MSLPKNMQGLRFGRLLVIGLSPERRRGQLCWLCHCDCGKEIVAVGGDLRGGNTKSCGCYRIERGRAHGAQIRLRHGEARTGKETPEYRIWASMLSRCENLNHKLYPDYGARGIKVCNRWHIFENFLADIGRRPPGVIGKRPIYTIDRIDNDGDYEPGNVRWATWEQQNNNQRPRGEGHKAQVAAVAAE